MAQGLNQYLAKNPEDEQTPLAPTLDQLMQQIAGEQQLRQSPMPTDPVAQAITQGQAETTQFMPKPIPGRPSIPQSFIQGARAEDWRQGVKTTLGTQDTGIDQLEKYIQDVGAQPAGTDWTALAALSDAWNPGSKLLAAAQSMKPMTVDEKQKNFINMQNLLQQRRETMAKNSQAPFAAELKAYQDMLRSMQSGGRQERFEANMDAKLFDKARKEQSELIKGASEFVNSSNNVRSAITPDADGTVSVARVYQSLSSFARLMGEKGVLTDYDIARQLMPTLETKAAQLGAMVSSNPNMRIPAQNVAAIQEALGTATEAFNQIKKMKRDAFTGTYFDNPGSPYAGREWAPKMVNEMDKALSVSEKPDEQAELEALRKKARGE